MRKRFATSLIGITVAAAVSLLAARTLDPGQEKKDRATPSLTGTWQMGLQGDHVVPVALVLEQDGKKVTGTIAMPTQHVGQRVDGPLAGEFVDGALILSGTVDHATEPTKIELSATLKDDGTLEGTLKMPKHTVPWTAERSRGAK